MAAAPGACGSLAILSSSGETGWNPGPAHASGVAIVQIKAKNNAIRYLASERKESFEASGKRQGNSRGCKSSPREEMETLGTGRSSCQRSMLPPPSSVPPQAGIRYSDLTFEYIRNRPPVKEEDHSQMRHLCGSTARTSSSSDGRTGRRYRA